MSPALLYIIAFPAALMLLFLSGYGFMIAGTAIKAALQGKDVLTEIQPLLNEW